MEKHYAPGKISARIIKQNFELGALITFARYGGDSTTVWAIYCEHKTPGELPYKSDGDARRKIQIKLPKETNVGVAQA